VPTLERRLSFGSATTINILAMIGVGPFLTIPLLLETMQGPQAMLGWVIGAMVAAADGLVWAELGAAMPQSGGGYHYMLQAYGPLGPGRLMSFLFLWSTVIAGPLYVASGAIGFAQYATYLYPSMTGWQAKLLAMAVCLLSTWLIYRRIDGVGRWGMAFGLGVLAAAFWILGEGALHARWDRIVLPANAFRLSSGFWYGLGGATLYAMYDYAGYNTVCGVGGEVVRPEKTIPRSIVVAIVAVAALYLAMNFSIIGVMPWQQAAQSKFVVSDFIAGLQGPRAAAVMTVLILAITLASVFALLLGFSRVPYAAARDGRFFKVFARLHPAGHFPSFSAVFLGIASAACCLLDLDAVIKAVTVNGIILGSLGAVVAPTLLRKLRPDIRLPFRMWLYPLPSLIAFAGWTYIVATSGSVYILSALGLLGIGIGAYFWRARKTAEWPWQGAKV
jgi:amino acid transporter